MKVAILHCYSAANAGDGLLVDETMDLLHAAFGPSVEPVIVASHPDTFDHLEVEIIDSSFSRVGYKWTYLRFLKSLDSLDLVVAVGGGYLRAGHLVESVKTMLVHGPQLAAAARTITPTIYLPQSIGPAKSIFSKWFTSKIQRVDRFYVRDDRSLQQFSKANVSRSNDLALLQIAKIQRSVLDVHTRPVLSIRAVRGRVSPLVVDLAARFDCFDGYIQSATAGNDDTEAMNAIGPVEILSRSALMGTHVQPRVVVAVRLHAALMAIRAGHFVIHLAYERKGFGAFSDLGLDKYVHNVNMFEPERVLQQVRELVDSESVREAYIDAVESSGKRLAPVREKLVREIRQLGMGIEVDQEFTNSIDEGTTSRREI